MYGDISWSGGNEKSGEQMRVVSRWKLESGR